MSQSHIEELTAGFDFEKLRVCKERYEDSKGYKCAEAVSIISGGLSKASSVIASVDDVAAPLHQSLQQSAVGDLLGPAKQIISFLQVFADAHPVLKIVVNVAAGVVQLELKRRENDKKIALLFYEMSDLLYLLCDLDAVFSTGQHLTDQLNGRLLGISDLLKDFGNFCDYYYEKRRTPVKLLKASEFRDKLVDYGNGFAAQKSGLHQLLTAQSKLDIIDIKRDVSAVLKLLQSQPPRVKHLEEWLHDAGGDLSAILKDESKVKELKEQFKLNIDASVRADLRRTIDDALLRNQHDFARRLEDARHQITDKIEASTQLLLRNIQKLDEGPYEWIEDENIKKVWKEMGARTSAKTRVFLDAVYTHFQQEIAKAKNETEAWTLHFLSKITFYQAIGDAIDDDCSGYLSVHEINDFMQSKPAGIQCSTAEWFAFWAAGPYRTDLELQSEVASTIVDMERTQVLPVNEKRFKHYRAITQRIKLIRVYGNIRTYQQESSSHAAVYSKLEAIRAQWRASELGLITAKLEESRYRFKPETVLELLGERRIEHYILMILSAVLYRHMQIVQLACERVVSVSEFEDMRKTLEALLDAFDQRLDALIKTWRQQRIDVETQVECFTSGIFEGWYELRLITTHSHSQHDVDDWEESGSHIYSQPVEVAIQESDARYESGNELIVTAQANDAVSEAHRSAKPPSPEDILYYPELEEAEEDDDLVDDEPDWPTLIARKHKVHGEEHLRMFDSSIDALQARMTTLEDMLTELLARIPAKEASPTPWSSRSPSASLPQTTASTPSTRLLSALPRSQVQVPFGGQRNELEEKWQKFGVRRNGDDEAH